MKLRALRLHNVRRFGGRGVEIANITDGVNVLSAANEYGKSTCFDALHALFFESFKTTPKTVQKLRPYSGGSPLIQADIETDDGLFRLQKRFYAGKKAVVTDLNGDRIVAQDDEAERWIGELVRGGAGGPAGLLWVQQGIIEMGAGGAKDKEQEKAARQDILTSVAGEIETLTGGRRMVQVLNRCQAELDVLVTSSGRPKANGPYDEAIKLAEELSNQKSDLEGKVAVLRIDLDERKVRRKRLAELEEPELAAKRQSDLEETGKALEVGSAHSLQLEQAIRAEKLAALEAGQSKTQLDQINDNLNNLADAEQRHKTEQGDFDQADRAHQKAVREEAETASATKFATTELTAAQETIAKAHKAAAARMSAEGLQEISDQLAKAETARQAAEQAKAEAKTLFLPQSKLDRLAEIGSSIDRLETEIRDRSATLVVDYEDGSAPTINFNGKPLQQDQTVTVSEAVKLEIDGVGSLTVSPGAQIDAAGAEQALRQLIDERISLLGDLQIDDLKSGHKRQHEAEQKLQESKRSIAQLEVLAPEGIEGLRAQVSLRQNEAEAADDDKVLPVAEAQKLLEGARQARDVAEANREEARQKLAVAHEQRIRAEAKLSATKQDLERLATACGPEAARADNRKLQEEQYRVADGKLTDARKAVRGLQETAPDIDTLKAAAALAASVAKKAADEITQIKQELAGLDSRIETKAEDGIEEALAEVTGQCEAADKRVEILSQEVSALQKLRQELERARADAKEQFFLPVIKELGPLLTLLFDDASVTFDEDTLLPHRIERNGQDEAFEVLSGGMREQLTVLTRLAFARLLARDGQQVPVILDDALIYSDDDRIEKMFLALHRQASDLQIIVFTCRQRAFDSLGGQGLRMEEWVPGERH